MKKFFDAIRSGNVDAIKGLLKQTPSLINCTDEMGLTPLMWAVHLEKMDFVTYLIDQGANVNAVCNQLGSSVIHFAAETDNVTLFELLMQKGANIQVLNVETHYSALHYAIMNHKHLMLDKLLTLNLAININTSVGDSLLHVAAKVGNLKALSILIKKGLNLEIKNAENMTIFDIARNRWELDMLAVICQYRHINASDYIYSRILSNIFNNKHISILLEEDGNNYTSGGSHHEAVSIVIEKLKQFLLINENKTLRSILTNLEMLRASTLSSNEMDRNSQIKDKELIYFLTGFDKHEVYGSLLRKDHQFVFSLYERGFFSVPTNTNTAYPVIQIETDDEERAEAALVQFNNVRDKAEAEASQILFDDIPAILQSVYNSDQEIEQMKFKNNRCYFENLKSLLLSEMIRHEGIKKGKELYKAFDLFMHFTSFKEFSKMATRSNKSKVMVIAIKLLDAKFKKQRINNERCVEKMMTTSGETVFVKL